MNQALKKFIVIDAILIAVFFLLFGNWYFNGSGLKIPLILIAMLIFSLIEGTLMKKISGVNLNPKGMRWGIARPADYDHKSLETLNKYWTASAILFVIIAISYIAGFHRNDWSQTLGFGALLAAIIIARLYENRRTIKGIKKKELFQ